MQLKPKCAVIALLLWSGCPLVTHAQKSVSAQPPVVDESELTLAQSLRVPEVPEKQKTYVGDYMLREARALKKMGYKVETMRKGEVVIATIPASDLFAPNDTVLSAGADARLKNFLPYFRTHGKFKVVLAMHSDDTGSDDYLYKLTERRIMALYDYFDRRAAQTDMLVGYPMADAEPVAGVSNATADGRRQNRRLEIYIVPGPMLIVEAKNIRR